MGIKKYFSAPLATGLGAMRRAAVLLLVMMLTMATAWANNKNITTYINYNGLTASDVTFTLSGNETSFELKNGETKSVDVPFYPLTTFTITCTSTKSIDAVSYSFTSSTVEQVEFTSDGNNGCSFQWWPEYNDLTLNINVIPGEAPQEGITITQNGSVNMPVSGDITVNIPDGVTKFYVYDDGGPSGNFSDGCNGQLLLIAPEGKLLKVNGTVTGTNQVAALARLAVYDGSSTSATMLYQSINGSVSNITSSGKQMLLHFYDIDNVRTETAAGLSLTVEVVEPTTAHSITIAGGLTHGTVTADKTSAMMGETVTLTVTTDVGYELGNITSVTLNSIGNNQYTFIMPDEDVTISASIHVSSLFGYKYDDNIFTDYNPDGSADYPYIISSADGWNLFCDCLAEENNTTWNRFSGKTVVLGNDIEVSRMAGSDSHDFCGTFDGQGNTLTFNYTTTEGTERVAPFSYVSTTTPVGSSTTSPAVIRRLNVVANITTNGQYAGGIVGEAWGEVTIEHCTVGGTITTSNQFAGGIIARVSNSPLDITDCRSSVTISSSVVNNNNNDGTHGGIAALVASSAKLNISGCVFDGKIVTSNGTTYCGGFVGHNNNGNGGSNVTIANSLYAPAAIADGETEVLPGTGNDPSATFVRNMIASNITNSYYTRQLGTAQGKAPLAVTAGENVTVESVSPVGSPTSSDDYNGVYTVSGITAYAKGITRTVGQTTTFYYGQGDQVSLTLSSTAPLGYQYNGFAASAGTLTGSDNPYTLTMPAEDVTISNALAPIDWATESTGADWDNAYMIYNKDQLDLLAQRVNSGTGDDYAASGYSGRYFKLGADIEYDPDVLTIDNDNDGTNESNYEAIGFNDDSHEMYFYFKGHFDGQGHTVSGIRIYKSGDQPTDMYQGLFGYIYSATVENIILADARITGHSYTAGIVGENYSGSVKNCHAMSNVTIHAVQSYACFHGGIVGYNSSTVTGCTSAAAITTADGLTGCYCYGGIAGRNSSTVKNCLYLGNTLNGNKYVGAIAGDNVILAFVTNSYYTDPAITGKDNSGNALDNANCAVGYNDRGTIRTDVFLAPKDDKDNTGFLALMADRNQALIAIERTTPLDSDVDITLNGRTLSKSGEWNTLCLPFDVEDGDTSDELSFTGTPLEGATVKELNAATSNLDNGTLTLNFTPANSIEAGKPYIVRWGTPEDNPGGTIVDPVFTDVTVSSTAPTAVTFTGGSFVGQYSPFSITADNIDEIILLSTGNRLGYSKNERTLRSFRAHFEVPTSGGVREFVLNFDDENTTGIISPAEIKEITDCNATLSKREMAGAWYSIDGRKLDTKPTAKGVYIRGGKKVIIK